MWLLIRVHFDALRLSPVAYLAASWWKLRRKRVRASALFAPLLGQSPNAYQLWSLRQDRSGRANSPRNGRPPLIALVDGAGGDCRLAATLDRLADEGVASCLVNADGLAGAIASIDWEQAPWLMPIVAGDRIAPGAAVAYRAAIAALGETSTRILYADDDQLIDRGRRIAPHFKPDWNSELFRHFDYLTGACIVRAGRDDLQALTGRSDWAQQLVAQATMGPDPVHLRQMLHHRHTRTAPRIVDAPTISSRELPPVTVIVPTRNRVDLLRTCLEGVAATDYPDIEIIVVDNDSDDPETLAYLGALNPARAEVLRHAGPFNYSQINNRAAAAARGRLLCLLNNDIEVTQPDWLAIMVAQALRDDVGAVGARLLYPDGRIQHAGVVIGVGNAAGHAHRFVSPAEEGYFRRHALPQFTSAVTAACLVVARDRFLAVGGLDEINFPVAFNDVDFCLRLNQRGWQSLYEPRATLIHHESVSRGLDLDPIGAARFAGELAALKRLWGTDSVVDPFHHPQLSRASERFAVAL